MRLHHTKWHAKPEMKMYQAQDELTKSLLSSIPGKLHARLQQIGAGQNSGWYGELVWKIGPDSGYLSITTPVCDYDMLRIEWTGAPDAVSNISTNVADFENLVDSLSAFVEVERAIYDKLDEAGSSQRV